jgi:seryl-tRNA synthetase
MQYESFLDNARAARATERQLYEAALDRMAREIAAEAAAKQELIALVAEYEKLLDAVESADLAQAEIAEGELDSFLEQHPNVPNYDARGNWVGRVSHENGWTP